MRSFIVVALLIVTGCNQISGADEFHFPSGEDTDESEKDGGMKLDAGPTVTFRSNCKAISLFVGRSRKSHEFTENLTTITRKEVDSKSGIHR